MSGSGRGSGGKDTGSNQGTNQGTNPLRQFMLLAQRMITIGNQVPHDRSVRDFFQPRAAVADELGDWYIPSDEIVELKNPQSVKLEIDRLEPNTLYGLYVTLIKTLPESGTPQSVTTKAQKMANNTVLLFECWDNSSEESEEREWPADPVRQEKLMIDNVPVQGERSAQEDECPTKSLAIKECSSSPESSDFLLHFQPPPWPTLTPRILKCAHAVLYKNRQYEVQAPEGYQPLYQIWQMKGPLPVADKERFIYASPLAKPTPAAIMPPSSPGTASTSAHSGSPSASRGSAYDDTHHEMKVVDTAPSTLSSASSAISGTRPSSAVGAGSAAPSGLFSSSSLSGSASAVSPSSAVSAPAASVTDGSPVPVVERRNSKGK